MTSQQFFSQQQLDADINRLKSPYPSAPPAPTPPAPMSFTPWIIGGVLLGGGLYLLFRD